MTERRSRSDADRRCRETYRRLEQAFRQDGLDADAVARLREELCYRAGSRWHVSPEAYEPTGVALGHPLLDSAITARLEEAADRLSAGLAKLCPAVDRTFAFVPPAAYHITLVNRTHFSTGQSVHALSHAEHESAAAAIASARLGKVRVRLEGLIVSVQGALLVPGFPIDDTLYKYRERLAGEVSVLSRNVPLMAHIKLGHLLADCREDDRASRITLIQECGEGLCAQLEFGAAYTSRGHIAFDVSGHP